MDAANRIYLDWAATAPLSHAAAAALMPFLAGGAGAMRLNANANSLHADGRAAFNAMEDARSAIARCLGARPDEVVFTSGATEADNMAVLGLAIAMRQRRERAGKGPSAHVVVSAVEHDAVLNAAKRARDWGFDVSLAKPDARGAVSCESLEPLLREDTVLVSMMTANNEVGTVEPVRALSDLAHAHGALFHTDAVQALGKIPIAFDEAGFDALSISGHKIGAPKGTGALLLKAGVACEALIVGGGQESGRRSGTQNVAGAVALAAAIVDACGDPAAMRAQSERLRALRDLAYRRLCEHPRVTPSVPCEPGSDAFLPHIVNVCVDGIESETLVLRYDDLGVSLSGGSACSSGSLEPSHVLTALGVPRDQAAGSLRLSFGPDTTEEDVERAVGLLDRVISWKR